jgi:hypothetical protein
VFVLTPPRVTARIVHLTWLGCPTDDVADELAKLALELVEDRDNWRALALAALYGRTDELTPRHSRTFQRVCTRD